MEGPPWFGYAWDILVVPNENNVNLLVANDGFGVVVVDFINHNVLSYTEDWIEEYGKAHDLILHPNGELLYVATNTRMMILDVTNLS